ncbi:N-6 DNA methylase [Stutzerimonas nitrititolerans]|uniref:N-6 DNA methylase n=1 Tax=Stutzerimonas nitrititolerans TaxID=2482751 RepID=UPI00289AC1C7|nr:N-6 DNA methylase [Stutzerimonas nitrititolerans]
MNDKVLWQLLDTIRGTGTAPYNALSLALQLLCWWKLSKEPEVPAHLRFEACCEQNTSAQLEALRSVQQHTRYPFLDEGAWQGLHGASDLSALTQKIRLLGTQGLLDKLLLDDVAHWSNESRFENFTYSPSLCELMVALAEVEQAQSIYIPWETSGQLAARVTRTGANLWVESQNPSTCAQVLNLIGGMNWELQATDPLRAPKAINQGKLVQFEATVCIPPMNTRYPSDVYENDLWGRFTEKTPVGNVLQIRHLLAQTQGLVVLAVPSSVLFGRAERQLREDLVSRGQVRAVIALPGGLCSGTPIPINILVLDSKSRSQSIRFVNANHEAFKETSGKRRVELKDSSALLQLVASEDASPFARNVTAEEIAHSDFSLEASRYVQDESAQKLSNTLKRYPLRKLGDFFEILRPRQHSTTSEGAEVNEVLAQDIPAFGYIRSASKEALFDLQSPKADSYFIKTDDILMTFKGVVGKAGIAGDIPPPGQSGWVAGQSLVLLRSRSPDQYPPKALLIFLRSAIGQGLLNQAAVGASIPSIQLSTLKNIEIPVPPLQTMHAMVQAFDNEARIQAEIESLSLQQAELTKAFWPL